MTIFKAHHGSLIAKKWRKGNGTLFFSHAISFTSKNQYGRHRRDRKPSCSKDMVRNLVIKRVDEAQIVIVGRLTLSFHPMQQLGLWCLLYQRELKVQFRDDNWNSTSDLFISLII